MTYSNNHPVRLVGGRLALDLLNTADWSGTGTVVLEKIETMNDLSVWLGALDLGDVELPRDIAQFRSFRFELRRAILGDLANDQAVLVSAVRTLEPNHALDRQPLLGLAAASALSILADPREMGRIKMCPGADCGWLFIDETRNARRKWCMMETCGNRAKAARHYTKVRNDSPAHN